MDELDREAFHLGDPGNPLAGAEGPRRRVAGGSNGPGGEGALNRVIGLAGRITGEGVAVLSLAGDAQLDILSERGSPGHLDTDRKPSQSIPSVSILVTAAGARALEEAMQDRAGLVEAEPGFGGLQVGRTPRGPDGPRPGGLDRYWCIADRSVWQYGPSDCSRWRLRSVR